ncbi:TPA: hypothetical protein ACKQHR_001535 [Pseudomonas aeruginosa]|nr:hypothetical protein [Pseudomonas aeruginosa]EIU2864249.1 hypothetical protein [Pseudomonas aeruginosa]
MKKRNFYPRQVLQQLAGKNTATLSDTQRHALKFFLLRSRRYNLIIALLQEASFASHDDLRLNVEAITSNAIAGNPRVFVGRPIRIETVDIPVLH